MKTISYRDSIFLNLTIKKHTRKYYWDTVCIKYFTTSVTTTTDVDSLSFFFYIVLSFCKHRECVKALVKSAVPSERACRGHQTRDAQNLTRLTGRHFLRHIIPTGTKKNITHSCVVCGTAEHRRAHLQDPTVQKS